MRVSVAVLYGDRDRTACSGRSQISGWGWMELFKVIEELLLEKLSLLIKQKGMQANYDEDFELWLNTRFLFGRGVHKKAGNVKADGGIRTDHHDGGPICMTPGFWNWSGMI